MVMDFAENRKTAYQGEIKSAHFGKKQMTLHPVVMYIRTPRGHLGRHSLMFVSDDITHDYHLVDHFTIASLEYAKQITNLKRAVLFSDGCAAQYKGRGTFADLSLLSGLAVQRAYFGSEHGKGEADGETGVLSQMLSRAVEGGQVNVSNAKDLYEWGQKTMGKEGGLETRRFILVKREEVNRQRPETNVSTIPGTRQFHQVERVTDYVLRCRKLACFCSGCKVNMADCCINRKHVGDYIVHKLKNSQTTALDTAFLEEEPEEPAEAEISQTTALDTAFVEEEPEEPAEAEISQNGAVEEDSAQPEAADKVIPKVGEYILTTHRVGKRRVNYVAVVTGPGLVEGEFKVSYMRGHNGTYTFPEIPDEWPLSPDDPDLLTLRVLNPPLIDNRGRYLFEL